MLFWDIKSLGGENERVVVVATNIEWVGKLYGLPDIRFPTFSERVGECNFDSCAKLCSDEADSDTNILTHEYLNIRYVV